ncbi:hypothetical protein [Streptomyces sp. NPDC058595]|uniref:hypothetical protein n=1 Tax=Streptomyces sp. NPDC058595 TaxID=3346550 RepID=UPI0036627DE1
MRRSDADTNRHGNDGRRDGGVSHETGTYRRNRATRLNDPGTNRHGHNGRHHNTDASTDTVADGRGNATRFDGADT